MRGGSLIDEVDQFFQAFFKWDVARRFVTSSAFSQARRKLSHRVFIELLDLVCDFLNREANLVTYMGMRVFAIDGSTMQLPNNKQVSEHFGVTKNNHGKRAMGRVSILHDVLNRITYDAILDSFNRGEISMAWDHLADAKLPDNKLILLDRGYYDFATLRNIISNNGHFCIRLRSNLGIFKAFMKTGLNDTLLTLKPPKQNPKGFSPEGTFRQSFTVRLVRYKVKKTTYILMTSLLDPKHTLADLGDLYHARWQVEESYKLKKCQLQIEHLSGATPEIVLQDFHAAIFKECLTTSLVLDAQERVEQGNKNKKFNYKVCLAQALAKMKNTLPLLFLRTRLEPLVEDLLRIFTKSLISIEPGREYPRHRPGHSGGRTRWISFGYRLNR